MSEKVQIVLDATMLDMFQLCEARFNNRFNLNKVQLDKPRPLDRGVIIHVGMEHYFNGLKAKLSKADSQAEAVRQMQFAIAEDECELSADDSARIIDVFIENTDYWWTRGDQNFVINEVERPFAYVLYEDELIRIVMIGKIDLLVSDNTYNNLPYDHKSYDRDYGVHRFTNQFCNYAVATGSNYLIVNRIGFQTSLKPEQKYKRVPLSYDPLILDKWKRNTIHVVKDKYLTCVMEGVWPMNLTSCDKFNRRCEYWDVCNASGIEAEKYKLEADFKTAEPWDVSKSLSHKGR